MRNLLATILLFVLTANPAGSASVTTYHGDNLRTGWNQQETLLSASRFPSTFRALHTVALPLLDDQVDAQPLFIPGLTIAGGTHDVVYVVTESNTVYAIDAASGDILVSQNLGTPVPAPFGCTNNASNVGITGTPVIDANAGLMYVIAYVKNGGTPIYQIHALNIITLQDIVAPVTVAASHTLVDGTTTVNFDASVQRQRPGLLLQDGVVYAGFGSFCDLSANLSRGWVLGWNANSNLAPLLTALAANELTDTLTAATTNFFLSSVWMAGYGIAGVSPNLYFVTGNSASNTYTGTTNIQESAIGLQEVTLSPIGQLFTEPNQATLDSQDTDFGSGGIMLLPDQAGAIPHMALVAGKDGILYLLNRDKFSPPIASYTNFPGCWCGPSYFVDYDGIPRVVTSQGNTLEIWNVNLAPAHLSRAATVTISSGQDPGFFTSVSSNGIVKGSAIIWAVGHPTSGNNNLTLYAYTALTSGHRSLVKLFSGTAGPWPFTHADANIVPTVANGRVYVGAYRTLTIFGAN